MSASERVLWERLRDRRTGFLFRRQHPISDFTLDFYCSEARLNVEVDGEQHARQRAFDRERDAKLSEQGILTIRVSSVDLFDEATLTFTRAIQRIVRACEERTGKKGYESF